MNMNMNLPGLLSTKSSAVRVLLLSLSRLLNRVATLALDAGCTRSNLVATYCYVNVGNENNIG